MNLLIIGDGHLRTRTPRRRTDPDFKATCLGKLRQVMDRAREWGCAAILQPGDLFDNPTPSGELMVALIHLLQPNPIPFLTIHGQHDMSYHAAASRKRSPLSILDAAGAVTLVDGTVDGHEVWVHKDVAVYGASFGQPPHELDSKAVGRFNVLMAHAMVGDKLLWPGQNLTGPSQYVQRHPGYDLYVLGDYHYPYIEEVRDATVINAGALLRLTAGKRDLALKPTAWVFNTEDCTVTPCPLDVEPVETTFDLTGREEKPEGPDLQPFIDKLRETGKVGVSFKGNLTAFFEEHDTPEAMREAVWKAMEEAQV